MTITAYPLTWPAGWKRTASGQRRRAQFGRQGARNEHGRSRKQELSIAEALERVLDELRALNVERETVIVSTNLDVRLDGLPRSGQRAPAYPGAAVYWARRGESRRRMAIDQYDRVADNLAAIAATLGYIRGIERHGGAEILDRAFTGFVALPAPAGNEWWEILGVARTATREEIKAAYRERVKTAHPDVGGDAEKFLILNKAYELATEATV